MSPIALLVGLAFAGDPDGDGIISRLDDCPKLAEDMDGFEDDDGCPESDNDRDGVPDASDKCPLTPEDRDGDADDDGCPEHRKSWEGEGHPPEKALLEIYPPLIRSLRSHDTGCAGFRDTVDTFLTEHADFAEVLADARRRLPEVDFNGSMRKRLDMLEGQLIEEVDIWGASCLGEDVSREAWDRLAVPLSGLLHERPPQPG
jgi:hypothetical protein